MLPRTIWVPILAMAAIAVGAFFFNEWTVKSNLDGAEQVAALTEMQTTLLELRAVVTDAETGARGFLLSSDRQYLEPFESALAQVAVTGARLRVLMGSDPALLARARRIESLRGQLIGELRATVILAQRGQEPIAVLEAGKGNGRVLMEAFRQEVQGLMAELNIRVGNLRADAAGWTRPTRILNLLFATAICLNVGMFFAGGSYEVVWSLYMTSLGADIGIIGLSFFSFALPPLLLSPLMGRLIDREGGFLPLIVGMAGIAGSGFLYPIVPAVWWMVALGLVEGTAFAMASPAIYLLVARSSPAGRTSTAQGLLGGAGTVGTIVASIAAGWLAAIDLAYPFYAVGVAGFAALFLGVALGRHHLYDAMQPRRQALVNAAAVPDPGR